MNYKKYLAPRWRRKFKRFFDYKLALVVAPVIAILLLFHAPDNFFGITIYFIAIVSSLIFYDFITRPRLKHFTKIDFKQNTDEIIEEAIEGIINSEKARPEFVHVAPMSEEALRDANDIIFDTVAAKTFYYITGRPGEGKSMYAYHLAYLLSNEGYKVYLLTLSSGIERYFEEIKTEFDYLQGKKKIILVDEAHNVNGNDKKFLVDYLCENSNYLSKGGNFIPLNEIACWIATEFLEEQSQTVDKYAEYIDVQRFMPELIIKFYFSNNPFIQSILIKKIDGLELATRLFNGVKDILVIKENFSQLNSSNFRTALYSYFNNDVKDPWTFNFIAAGGEIKLIEQLGYLTRHQQLILFFISARVVMSGNREVSFNELSRNLFNVKIPSYSHDEKELIKDIKELQKNDSNRKAFISVSPKKKNIPDFISAHHFNTARVLIKAILDSMTQDADDFLKAASVLLTGNKKDLKYLYNFDLEIGDFAVTFNNDYKELLKEYFNQPLLDNVINYQPLLTLIKRKTSNIYHEIRNNIDNKSWVEMIQNATTNQFQSIGEFLIALASGKDKIIEGLSANDLKELKVKIGAAGIENLNQAAALINSLGNVKSALIKEFTTEDYKNIARKIGDAGIENFGRISDLTNSLGNAKSALIKEFTTEDYRNIARKIGDANIENVKQAADLINSLGNAKSALIKEFTAEDYKNIARKIGTSGIENLKQAADFINSLGNDKSALIKEFTTEDYRNIARKIGAAGIENLNQAADFINSLGNDRSALIKELELIESINYFEPNQFELLAQFINACESFGSNFLEKINFDKIIFKLNQQMDFSVSLLRGLTTALSFMKKAKRDDFIEKINWDRIYFLLPISDKYIRFHGYILRNLIQNYKNGLESTNFQKIKEYFELHLETYSLSILNVHFTQLGGLSVFLQSVNLIDNSIAVRLTKDTFIQNLIDKTMVEPRYFSFIAGIINSLRHIDQDKALQYVTSYKLQKFIPIRFNSSDWHNSKTLNLVKYDKEKEGAIRLIKAIYRTSKDAWQQIRSKLDSRKK